MQNEEPLSGRAIVVIAMAVALILIPLGRELGRQYRTGPKFEVAGYGKVANAPEQTVVAAAPPGVPHQLHRAPRALSPKLSPGSVASLLATYDSTATFAAASDTWELGDFPANNGSSADGWQATWEAFPCGAYPSDVSVKLKVPASAAHRPAKAYTVVIRSLPDESGNVDVYRYDFSIAQPTLKKPAR